MTHTKQPMRSPHGTASNQAAASVRVRPLFDQIEGIMPGS